MIAVRISIDISPTVSDEAKAMAKAFREDNELSIKQICDTLEIVRSTFYKYVKAF